MAVRRIGFGKCSVFTAAIWNDHVGIAVDVWTDTTGQDSAVLVGAVRHYRAYVVRAALGTISDPGDDGTADADGFGMGDLCTVGAPGFGSVLVGCDLRRFFVAVPIASGAKPGGFFEICQSRCSDELYEIDWYIPKCALGNMACGEKVVGVRNFGSSSMYLCSVGIMERCMPLCGCGSRKRIPVGSKIYTWEPELVPSDSQLVAIPDARAL